MKKAVIFLLILTLSNRALADQIYGSLRLRGQPFRNVDITVDIGGKQYSFRTDSDGAYQIFIREVGRARLTVKRGTKAGSFDVASYKEPVRYDFEVIENSSGFTLTRR